MIMKRILLIAVLTHFAACNRGAFMNTSHKSLKRSLQESQSTDLHLWGTNTSFGKEIIDLTQPTAPLVIKSDINQNSNPFLLSENTLLQNLSYTSRSNLTPYSIGSSVFSNKRRKLNSTNYLLLPNLNANQYISRSEKSPSPAVQPGKYRGQSPVSAFLDELLEIRWNNKRLGKKVDPQKELLQAFIHAQVGLLPIDYGGLKFKAFLFCLEDTPLLDKSELQKVLGDMLYYTVYHRNKTKTNEYYIASIQLCLHVCYSVKTVKYVLDRLLPYKKYNSRVNNTFKEFIQSLQPLK